jgi:benzoyl-CoA reductase/2-hydroxyglutaryl-CoA dehydratase subunit BcrC/BadD/HgdB
MIVETAGAVIVGEESCVGERGTRNLTDDSGETVDEMLDAIVDRYFQVDCAIFTPNPDRLITSRKWLPPTRPTALSITACSFASHI